MRAMCCFAAAMFCLGQAQAASPMNVVDAQLINACAARTDARMESMTLRKLDQIRNYEFSLRMAIAQLAGGTEAFSPTELRSVTDSIAGARQRFASVCEISLPMHG